MILGVDPGKDGAAVLLDPSVLGGRYVAHVRTADLVGEGWHRGGGVAVAAWLREAHGRWPIRVAVLELFAGRSGEGRGGLMTVGVGWGTWYGALLALGIEVRTPSSAGWARTMFAGVQGEGKERAVTLARMRWPDLPLMRGRETKPRDGIADAACLAGWGVGL